MKTLAANARCPCGGPSYGQCCGRFIEDNAIAPTAQELMRSRYTAITLEREAYLRVTWHPRTCPPEPIIEEGNATQWLGLEVLNHHTDGDNATVEFVARYQAGGRAMKAHEVSQFVRENGRWLYTVGKWYCADDPGT